MSVSATLTVMHKGEERHFFDDRSCSPENIKERVFSCDAGIPTACVISNLLYGSDERGTFRGIFFPEKYARHYHYDINLGDGTIIVVRPAWPNNPAQLVFIGTIDEFMNTNFNVVVKENQS